MSPGPDAEPVTGHEDYDRLPGLSIRAMHVGEFDRSEAYMKRLLSRAEGPAMTTVCAVPFSA